MRLRPPARSSDIDEARAIARRLEPSAGSVGAEEEGSAKGGYVRFAQAGEAGPRAQPEPAPQPPATDHSAPTGSDAEPLVDAGATSPPSDVGEEPTWDTLLLASQALADAQAAMVVAPDGGVIAATGQWPSAGAQTVAGKLLPLVARKLDAGGVVPVKLAGQVLTTWRLEVAGQPLTVALLAGKAVPADLRPEVDRQLSQGRPG